MPDIRLVIIPPCNFLYGVLKSDHSICEKKASELNYYLIGSSLPLNIQFLPKLVQVCPQPTISTNSTSGPLQTTHLHNTRCLGRRDSRLIHVKMAFSFGFSGDDIDIDDSEINQDFSDMPSQQAVGNSLPELVKASRHDMNEWVSDQARYFILNYAYYIV